MKPNFKSGTLLGENLMGCEMRKIKVVVNKPVYLGQAILDLSKIIMYEFHYDYMLPKYGDKIKLCYMDTDSYVYDIKTEDFYKDIAKDVETRFDTSAYSNNRPLPIGKNKKVIGLMKDELGGGIMKEFVALRAKMYSYTDDRSELKKCKGIKKSVIKREIRFADYKRCLLEGINIYKSVKEFVSLRPKMYSYRVGKNEPKKCKGIKKSVVKKTITFDDYKDCLFKGINIYKSQLLFRSDKHEIKTLEVNKLALNSQDDKRIWRDLIDSYAMGHYKTI